MLKYPLGDNSIQTKGERIMLNVNLLSLGLSSSTLYAIIAAGLLIHSILCGAMTSVLLKAKGYSGMVFFLGLFGGVAAILFAIGMPTRNDR